MIWYLVFCTDVYAGNACPAPLRVENKHVCQVLAAEIVRQSGAKTKCIGFRK
jgi:hypothetical protein